MDQEEVLDRIQRVLDDVFTEDIKAHANLSAAEVDEWDSLTNVALLIAIEHEFGVKLSAGEAASLKNVGDLVSLIVKRVQK